MENLPVELSQRIFRLLDHQQLAAAQQVCRNWMNLATQDELWHNLFIKRWGIDQAEFFRPLHPKTWKTTYETQDRCDRVGLGLTITREGSDYYLVYQGEIQQFLGSKKASRPKNDWPDSEGTGKITCISNGNIAIEGHDGNIMQVEEGPCLGLFDRILFFVGDLECASRQAKRARTQ